MIRFEYGALVEFGERFVVTSLIKKDARAVVTGDDALSRIQSRHALKAPQRLLVIAVEPGHHPTRKMNPRIVGSFAGKLLGHFARALLFSAGKINQDGVTARLQQIRIDRQSFVEGFHRGIVIARLAGGFYAPVCGRVRGWGWRARASAKEASR